MINTHAHAHVRPTIDPINRLLAWAQILLCSVVIVVIGLILYATLIYTPDVPTPYTIGTCPVIERMDNP